MGDRYLPGTPQDREKLLRTIGVSSVEELLKGIPADIRYQGALKIGPGQSEFAINKRLKQMFKDSRESKGFLSFNGAGCYSHVTAACVNQLTLRGEFLTSYTPYQPEMAQGTLQAMFEFQTMISEIFGMDVATASHYDGSTAMAEAVLMALRLAPDKKQVLLSQAIHPEYLQVLKNYTGAQEIDFVTLPTDAHGVTSVAALQQYLSPQTACVVVQSPNFFGCVEPLKNLSDFTHQKEALFVVNVTEATSLGIINPPGAYGADIVCGEGQALGIPESFGGPYLGLFATKREFVRQLPGRLCGMTFDAQGRRSFTLTLSTREQHIRREKATSNICTNQNLLALWATIWMSLVGKQGFIELASQNVYKTEYAKQLLLQGNKVKLRYPQSVSYNEFVVDVPGDAHDVFKKCVAQGVAPGVPLVWFNSQDKTGLLVCVTETKTKQDIDTLCRVLQSV